MGIDTDIRKLMREKWAPSAFFDKALGKSAIETAIVDDVLTWMFQCKPSNTDFTSGQDVCDYFFRRISRAVEYDCCKVYIAIADDQAGVPKEKAATQAKRNAKDTEANKPYPSGATLSLEGIKLPGSDTYESVEIPRLMRTRPMRKSLWLLINAHLTKVACFADCTVIFDFDKDTGPWIHTADSHSADATLCHDHGEADLAIPVWCYRYRQYAVEVHTTDTDVIPILFAFIHGMSEKLLPRSLHWVYHQYNRSSADIYTLMRETLAATKLSVPQFVLACLIAGTDYVQKKPVAHSFNPVAIFEAAKRIEVDDAVVGIKDVVLFNRSLFTTKLTVKAHKKRKANEEDKKEEEEEEEEENNNKRSKTTAEYWFHKPEPELCSAAQIIESTKGKKKHVIPTEAEFQTAYDQVSFNYPYWMHSWKHHVYTQ